MRDLLYEIKPLDPLVFCCSCRNAACCGRVCMFCSREACITPRPGASAENRIGRYSGNLSSDNRWLIAYHQRQIEDRMSSMENGQSEGFGD